MASSAAAAQPCPPDSSTPTTPTKNDQNRLKECPICTSTVSSYSKSPSTYQPTHDRACSECWEVHLSTELETKPTTSIQCLFCHNILNAQDFERLSRKATFERYQYKILEATGRRCMARCRGTESTAQAYNRETDGRVFTCTLCSFPVCTDCDRPEHVGETCSPYRARTQDSGQDSTTGMYPFIQCPSCSTYGEIVNSGCGYVVCKDHSTSTTSSSSGGCGHRYCSHCLAPWVGPGSYYLLGATAHRPTCRYYSKIDNSMHGLKHRFELDGKGQAKEDAKRARQRESAKKSKLKREMAQVKGEVEGASGGGSGESDEGDGDSPESSKKRKAGDDGEIRDAAVQGQNATVSNPKPPTVRKRGKKAAAEESRTEPVTPETKARREKQALRREKRKGLEQKKREMENPSAELLAAWEEQFGSAAT